MPDTETPTDTSAIDEAAVSVVAPEFAENRMSMDSLDRHLAIMSGRAGAAAELRRMAEHVGPQAGVVDGSDDMTRRACADALRARADQLDPTTKEI